jgi:hypothetical protein
MGESSYTILSPLEGCGGFRSGFLAFASLQAAPHQNFFISYYIRLSLFVLGAWTANQIQWFLANPIPGSSRRPIL